MYPKHKYNIFPEIQGEDYERLKFDIESNGFDPTQPIWVFQGAIIDGWNRQRACIDTGISAIYKQFQGSEMEAFNFVMRTNKRRNLTSSQWACIAVEEEDIVNAIKEHVEQERRRKQAENFKNRYTKSLASDKKLSEAKNEHATKTHTKIAQAFNTNRTYVNNAKKLREENEEAFQQIKGGVKTFSEWKREQKQKEREAYIEQQKRDIAESNLPEIKSKFDLLVFDPPWPYGREYDPDSSRVANPYPEMSIQQIKEIEVPGKDSSIMFLWTTHQFLRDAFDILEDWGYIYKATMVWNKEKIGMGYWLRMQCEFCLLAVKGKPIWDITDWRDIFSEPRRQHSRKPDSFFNQIDKYFPYASKLEYFSREQREGWSVYGNETNKF